MGPQELALMAWTQAWQLTALIVAVLLAVRLWGRTRPHLVHALWIVVLLKAITPPVVSSPFGVFSQVPIFNLRATWLFQAEDAGGAPLADGSVREDSGEIRIVSEGAEQPLKEWRGAGQLFRIAGSPVEDDPENLRDGMLPAKEMSSADDVPSTTERSLLERSASYSSTWISYAGGTWIAGATLLALVAAVRWLACLRHLCRHARMHDVEAESLLADLSRQLKVRRRVRLWITEGRIGPAVVGIFRPTILLPALIVRGRSPKMLGAILAHELLHIRRGDLWVGWLQLVAQGVWWFHPLVWLAGRRATRAAEACCDAETIAELGCAPADYAASLLDVLELKTRLVSIPAVPGLKPVDVTRERLEQIMQLRQGCRQRSPWSCRLALWLTAAATLPGAAWMAAADDAPVPSAPMESPRSDTKATAADSPAPQAVEATKDKLPADESLTWERTVAEWNYQVVSKSAAPYSFHVGTKSGKTVDVHEFGGSPHIRIRRAGVADAATQIVWFRADEMYGATDEPGPEASHYAISLSGKVSLKFGEIDITADRGVVRIPLAETQPTTPGGPARIVLELENATWAAGEFRIRGERLTARFGTRGSRDAWKMGLYDLTMAGVARVYPLGAEPPPSVCEGSGFAVTASKIHVSFFTPTWWPPLKGEAVGGRPQALRATGNGRLLHRSGKSGSAEHTGESIDWNIREHRIKVNSQNVDRAPTSNRKGRTDAKVQLLGIGVNSDAALVGDVTLTEGNFDLPDSGRKRIEQALSRKISLQFDETPLSEVVKQLAAKLEVNVVLDPIGLTDEGLKPKSTVSIQLTEISAHSALKLIFEPLHLVYFVEDDVLKITSRPRAHGPLTTITYAVADLVVLATSGPGDPKSKADFKSLISLITSSIEPDTWDEVGGPGSVRSFDTTLSLVIRQTPDVHDQISDLLGQLRRLQDLQAAIEISLVRLPRNATLESVGLKTDPRESDNGIRLSEAQAAAMHEAIGANSKLKLRQSPKPTLFNGQGAELTVPLPSFVEDSEKGISLHLAAVIGADHRNLRMTLAVGAKTPEEAIARNITFVSLDGQTSVIDITDNLHPLPFPGLTTDRARDIDRRFDRKLGERTLMIVTPRIIKVEEEEVRKSSQNDENNGVPLRHSIGIRH